MRMLTKEQAEAQLEGHASDGRAACQCVECLWARASLADIKTKEAGDTAKVTKPEGGW